MTHHPRDVEVIVHCHRDRQKLARLALMPGSDDVQLHLGANKWGALPDGKSTFPCRTPHCRVNVQWQRHRLQILLVHLRDGGVTGLHHVNLDEFNLMFGQPLVAAEYLSRRLPPPSESP